MYNVMIVEDDPMARRLLEIMVTSDESYHLAVSADSDYYHHQPSGMQFHRTRSRGRSGQLLVQRTF